MIITTLFSMFPARRQAAELLDQQGERAIAHLSERIAAAMRTGDERGAVHLDRILQHVENAVDAAPGAYATH